MHLRAFLPLFANIYLIVNYFVQLYDKLLFLFSYYSCGTFPFRPKNKYIRITSDEFFSSEDHYLSNTPTKAEKACSYDLDDCDLCWLQTMNGERALMGKFAFNYYFLEFWCLS